MMLRTRELMCNICNNTSELRELNEPQVTHGASRPFRAVQVLLHHHDGSMRSTNSHAWTHWDASRHINLAHVASKPRESRHAWSDCRTSSHARSLKAIPSTAGPVAPSRWLHAKYELACMDALGCLKPYQPGSRRIDATRKSSCLE